MLAHDLFARFVAHPTRCPSPPTKGQAKTTRSRATNEKRSTEHRRPKTVDTVRATTPPAYPFPQTNHVKQPGQKSPPQQTRRAKTTTKSQISPAPAAAIPS